jgi:hypothetical protein
VGGRHLDRRTGRSRYVASTSATARLGTRTYLLDVAVDRRRKKWHTDERWRDSRQEVVIDRRRMDRCNDKKCLPSPLLDVLALNVGKDCVQRSSKKVACRLDALFCSIKKIG